MGRKYRSPKRNKPIKSTLPAGYKIQVRRKLRFQFIYILAVIVPYIFIIEATYNIFKDPDPLITLSRIGWRTHVGGPRGVWFLIFFVALTCPFMVYQVWFYLKHSGRKGRGARRLFILSTTAAVSVATGAAMPYNKTRAEAPLWHLLHNGFAMLGALLAVLAVTLILIQVCREADREIILVFYALFAAFVYAIYSTLHNAAAFQIGMTFTIFVVMYYINKVVLYRNVRKNLFKLKNEGVER